MNAEKWILIGIAAVLLINYYIHPLVPANPGFDPGSGLEIGTP